MVEPLEAKRTASTEDVWSSPVHQAPRGTQHLLLSSGTRLNFPYITSEASNALVPFIPSLLCSIMPLLKSFSLWLFGE